MAVMLLVAGIFVSYAYFGMDYLRQSDALSALTAELADAAEELTQAPAHSRNDLDEQLAAAEATLSEARSEFPSEIDRTQAIDAILKLASDSGVKTLALVAQPWATVSIQGSDYRVIQLDLEIEGSFSQVVSFITELENEALKTLVINEVRVTTEEDISHGNNVTITAKLVLATYARAATTD